MGRERRARTAWPLPSSMDTPMSTRQAVSKHEHVQQPLREAPAFDSAPSGVEACLDLISSFRLLRMRFDVSRRLLVPLIVHIVAGVTSCNIASHPVPFSEARIFSFVSPHLIIAACLVYGAVGLIALIK